MAEVRDGETARDTSVVDESKPEQPEQPEPQPIQMIIQLLPNGTIQVNGPIRDKILSYGMLELAKEEIQRFHAQADKKPEIEVVKNGHGILNFARRKNG